MAPTHKAETVDQMLTNHKKPFTISRNHFHCTQQTGEQLVRKSLPCQPAEKGKSDNELMERSIPCSLATMLKQSWWLRNQIS